MTSPSGTPRPSSVLPPAASKPFAPSSPFLAEDATPSERFDGEDFLFHLYRGSELLQDNCVEQAKEELERALRMQPKDAEGQGLLGVVYFRLGLYPRAIEIYREIVRDCPEDVTPKLNLALCYFKTGQPKDAQKLLEEVLERAPEHPRAWGYLGLVFERLSEYERAEAAFERAGQPHLARRMHELLGHDPPDAPPPEPDAHEGELRRAAAAAVEELESASADQAFVRAESLPGTSSTAGLWRAIELGREPLPPLEKRKPRAQTRPVSILSSLDEPHGSSAAPERVPGAPLPALPAAGSGALEPLAWIDARRVPDLSPGAARALDGRVFVNVRDSFAARAERLCALVPANVGFQHEVLPRRFRGRPTAEPFSTTASWVTLHGSGLLWLDAAGGRELVLFELAGEFVYVRESRLVGFDGALRYENGRLPAEDPGPVPMVQFAGHGLVVFETSPRVRSVAVAAACPLTVRAAAVVGWTGRLLGQAVKNSDAPSLGAGFVAFNGDGSVLVDEP